MHWSEPHIEFIRGVVSEIAHVPLYILKVDESAVEWNDAWMAAFSPLADLQAQTALESLGLWQGRGICIRVRDDFETWSNRCKAGTLLHEVSHALEFLSQPDALVSVEELSPVAREMLNGNESELLAEVGIDRNDMIAEQHGADFVRLCCHLYWRARQQVVLSPADLQFLHGIYSLGSERFDDVMTALTGELAMSRNLNLMTLREPPEAFQRMFR